MKGKNLPLICINRYPEVGMDLRKLFHLRSEARVKKDIVIVMGLKLNFVVQNTKQIGINQTFQNSSARTSALKRNVTDKREVGKNPYDHKVVDKNGLQHKVRTLRSSGGIPKVSRPSRLTL
jgi:hypothetical protein